MRLVALRTGASAFQPAYRYSGTLNNLAAYVAEIAQKKGASR